MSLELQVRMHVEVCMNAEVTAASGLMQTAADLMRIGYQPFDAADLFKKTEKGSGIEGVDQRVK